MPAALNHKNIVRDAQEISKTKSFIGKDNWKKFEINNKAIALNILYVPYGRKEMRHAHISKHNSKCKTRVILLMIMDNEKHHNLAKNIIYII